MAILGKKEWISILMRNICEKFRTFKMFILFPYISYLFAGLVSIASELSDHEGGVMENQIGVILSFFDNSYNSALFYPLSVNKKWHITLADLMKNKIIVLTPATTGDLKQIFLSIRMILNTVKVLHLRNDEKIKSTY